MSRRRMREKDAIIWAGVLGAVLLLISGPLWMPMIWAAPNTAATPQTASGAAAETEEKVVEEEEQDLTIIDESGLTLADRVNPPQGYQRKDAQTDSFLEFMRSYALKKSTGKVKLYSGTVREEQDGVQAVFKLPLEKMDLQRAAGTITRVYAEYFWETRQYDKISFRFNNGFQAEYKKWRQGYRIQKSTTGMTWVSGGTEGNTREEFVNYMQEVLTYTSASSLKEESKKIKKSDLQAGDIFLQTDNDADAVMVVDVCENEDGQRAFLLAKGGNPAQQFHLLKNPAHEDDPWYYEDEIKYPLQTSEGTFNKGTLFHPKYADE